jgi:Zn-dependent protease with chaperone function
MAIELATRYPGLSPRTYEHPADRAATSALHAIPMLDRVVKRIGSLGIESRFRQQMLGDAVRLGPDQVPDVWNTHVRAATRLDLADVPPLFVTQYPISNALTFGMRRPVIVMSSSLVAHYDADEVESVLAHEIGHVCSDHVTYSTAMVLLGVLLQGALSDVPLADLPVRGLYLALLEWHRAAELTCDRAAAIEVDDPMVVCRMLMRMAGGALPGMQIDAFIRQATEYVGEEDLFARYARFTTEIGRTHPLAVRRVRELITWVQAGEFDRIRSGSYVHKGEEPPPSAEFDAAVRHYRERFTGVIERTAGGVSRLSGQISSWLRRQSPQGSAGDPADGDDGDGLGDDGPADATS